MSIRIELTTVKPTIARYLKQGKQAIKSEYQNKITALDSRNF